MAKKGKSFQNVSMALGHIWGSPASAQNQGGRAAKSARYAGVTRDHHLTPMAQQLAAEIQADEIAATQAADPRSAFEKKYDIRDNLAHVTPEQFCELLLSYQNWQRMQNSVKTIHIENGHGLSADFTFTMPDEENKNLEAVSSRSIVKLGLSGIISNADRIIVRRGRNDIGILKILSTPVDLMCHSQIASAETGPSMKNETRLMVAPEHVVHNLGNARELFASAAELESKLKMHFKEGIELTASTFRKSKYGPLTVGTVWHPDRVNTENYPANGYIIRTYPYGFLRRKVGSACYYAEEDPVQFISDFFNGASGFELMLRGKSIAIVLRADLPAPPKTTLG